MVSHIQTPYAQIRLTLVTCGAAGELRHLQLWTIFKTYTKYTIGKYNSERSKEGSQWDKARISKRGEGRERRPRREAKMGRGKGAKA